MQYGDDIMANPTGVGSDALLSTLVNHVGSREGAIEAAELDLIFGIVSSLSGRVSPEAMAMAQAKLSALVTAKELAPVADIVPFLLPEQIQHNPEPMEPVLCQFQDRGHDSCLAPDSAGAHMCAEAEMLAAEGSALETQTAFAGMAAADDCSRAAICPPAMLVALAATEAPSARLCNLIVARGHPEALAAIARNPAARFARSSLTTMVELAASDLSLRLALCSRADLTDMILDRLWPYLSQAAKASVIAVGCRESHGEAALLCADALRAEANGGQDAEETMSVDAWSAAIHAREATLCQAMRTLDNEGRIVDVAMILAARGGLPPEIALTLLLGSYDRGAVALARLAGCDDDSLGSLIHVRGRAGARGTADRRGPMHAFARMGEDEAGAILRNLMALLPATDAAAVTQGAPAPETGEPQGDGALAIAA